MIATVERFDVGAGRELARFLFLSASIAPVSGAAAENWIQILPLGPEIVTNDGRQFTVSDLDRVIASSRLPVLIDWEHLSELGGPTKAAGWVVELASESGQGRFPSQGLWGRAQWTPTGASDVRDGSYRYLSPVVGLDKGGDGILLKSVALTNQPALTMQAIEAMKERFSAQYGQKDPQAMKPEARKILLASLKLVDASTDEQIVEAVTGARASAEMCSTLTGQVTTLSTQLGAKTQEVVLLSAKVAELEKGASAAAFEVERKDLFDAAGRDGKITPAMRPAFEALCSSKAQLDAFKPVLLSMPKIAEPAPASVAVKAGEVAIQGSDGKVITLRNVPAGVDVVALRKSGLTPEEIQRAVDYQNTIAASRRAEA